MLHLVISTPRSGSNALCKLLAQEHSAVNLYEPVTDHRDKDNELTTPIELIVKQTLSMAKDKHVVAKFHIDHLMLMYPQNINVIRELFSLSKLYYCFRLNFSEQIKSIYGIKKTSVCDERSEMASLFMTGHDAKTIASALAEETSIMGEWYKEFNGEICILEKKSETYFVNGFSKYKDTYNYTYDSANTKQFVEQSVDVLEIFNKGNPLYKIFGV